MRTPLVYYQSHIFANILPRYSLRDINRWKFLHLSVVLREIVISRMFASMKDSSKREV